MYSNGVSLSDRLGWAVDWHTTTRRRRPDLEVAMVDAAYDNLVDLVLARDDVGASRNAVFALGRKQLGWRICTAIRARRLANGEMRLGPASALSLDRLLEGGDASSRREPRAREDVADAAIRRLSFKKVIAQAREAGPTTAVIIVGYTIGIGPDELAAQTGLKANTVTQRKGRFERAHREEIL